MNVKFVEFYPISGDESVDVFTGTIRVKLPDLSLDILGIFVSKKKNTWFFGLPGRQGIDAKSGEKIRYPFIVFEDREQQKALLSAIRERAPAFIEKRTIDKENPIVWPEKKKVEDKKLSTVKVAMYPSEAKPKPTITDRVWRDPPKMLTSVRRGRN